jgi:pre-mRNA-splicing factor 38B
VSTVVPTQLVLHEDKQKRARMNRRNISAFREGARVRAIYEDEENEPAVSPMVAVQQVKGDLGEERLRESNSLWQWYDAVITEQQGDEEYLVTYDGYGNQEVVGLGDLQLPPSSKKEGDGSRSKYVGTLAQEPAGVDSLA